MKFTYLLFSIILLATSPAQATGFEKDIDNVSGHLAKKLEAAKVKNVAVIDFTDVHSNITELGRFIAEELSTSLVLGQQAFSVIDRSHLKHILNEQKLSVSGLLDPKNTAKIGKLAGVDALVLGTITPFGDNVRMTIKVLDTKTAHLIAAERATIAKTQAIDELLSREVIIDQGFTGGGGGGGGGSASGTTTIRRPASTSVFTSNGLEFRANKLLVGKSKATLILTVINKEKKDKYLWLLQSGRYCETKDIKSFIYSDTSNQGYLHTAPGIGITNNSSRCTTAGALIEKQNQITATFSFTLEGAEKSKSFDFSSIMYLSEGAEKKQNKRLSVTLTDIRPAK